MLEYVKWTHTGLRFQTGVITSSVHMTFHFGWVSKRPDILMNICRYFISGSVYMIILSPKMKFYFCLNDQYEIHIRNEFQTHMRIKRNILRLFISFRVNSVHMKISCRFEISFRLKWLILNPYRFEFHFASIPVNTKKELTEHWSEIFNRNEISYRFEFISSLMWTYS